MGPCLRVHTDKECLELFIDLKAQHWQQQGHEYLQRRYPKPKPNEPLESQQARCHRLLPGPVFVCGISARRPHSSVLSHHLNAHWHPEAAFFLGVPALPCPFSHSISVIFLDMLLTVSRTFCLARTQSWIGCVPDDHGCEHVRDSSLMESDVWVHRLC